MTHLRWVMSFQQVSESPSHPQSWATGQNTNALHISYNICSYEQQMFYHAQVRFADWWLTFVGSWAFNSHLTVLAILSFELQGRIPMLCISPIAFAVMNNKCLFMRKPDLRTDDTPSLGHELSKSIWQSLPSSVLSYRAEYQCFAYPL
jgi:hypothetical protein